MNLNDAGRMVEKWYDALENKYPDKKCHQMVVMPNHFHAIIIIGENEYNRPGDTDAVVRRDAMHRVSTTAPNGPANKFGPQSKNLASIIRGFKSAVTINARKIHSGFAWQSRFHDHIIRDEQSYQNISEYIINNPAKWEDDKFYPTSSILE